MLDKIKDIITYIINLIMSYIRRKNKDTENKKELSKQEKEVDKAIENNDVDKLNSILHSVVVIGLSLCLFGCTTVNNNLEIPKEQKIEKMTYNNIEGYFVPKQMMGVLIKYKLRYDYYKEKYGDID